LTQFETFGLAAPILRALAEEGYASPTPIQTQAIPGVLAGRDLQGIAQTGTGKTAAFALPILHRLASDPKRPRPREARVLVLSPTRELASQICDSFRTYGRHLRISSTVVFGGVPVGRQQRALAGGVDVLVATPGRLLDLVDQRSLNLGGVEILVLDEADQMLDLGFIHALRRVVTLVPKKRQTLFFSATMPKAIEQLSAQFISDPIKVAVAPVATTAERVTQSVLFVGQAEKPNLLRAILQERDIERVLVFTRTKHGADRVVGQLARSSIPAAAIHGNKSQGQRERALADFKAGRNRVLVATDIAARGIDVDGVSHVVNFDLPNVPESYVHRIGRTARAGADGEAISFCNREEREYLRDIEKLTRLKVPEASYPAGFVASQAEPDPVPEQRRDARPSGQRQPRRPGSPEGRQRFPSARESQRPRERADGERSHGGRGRTPTPQGAPRQHAGQAQPARAQERGTARGRDARQEGGHIAWLQRGPRSGG
jgi:ATP-dependent RNA helicase RhlE